MNSRFRLFAIVSLIALAAGPTSHAELDGPLRLPDDDAPDVVRDLGLPEDRLAFAIAPDASAAAVALAHPSHAKKSLVRLALEGGGEVGEWEIRGIVRALRFGPEGAALFGVVGVPAKKGISDAYLMRIEAGSKRYDRLISLPSSASDLDNWTARGSILVACRNELRSVLLPAGRSGPLYWVRGENPAIASLPGGDRVLVGQPEEILLVDLSDPHDEDRMPVRDRIRIPGPPAGISAAPDGSAALVRLTGGRTFTVKLDPLVLQDAGNSDAIAWLGRPVPPPPPPPEAAAAPEAMPAIEPPAPREPPPKAGPTPEPPAVKQVPEKTPPGPEEPPPAPREEVVRIDSSRGTVEGAVDGPAAGKVLAVVLLGPDNILREAARIAPGADGAWQAGSLDPGIYRVVLDGGGGVVLATDPPFRVVEVEAGVRKRLPPIRVLRAR
jgi:hypothetical protein